jgi:hypothetical protein
MPYGLAGCPAEEISVSILREKKADILETSDTLQDIPMFSVLDKIMIFAE